MLLHQTPFPTDLHGPGRVRWAPKSTSLEGQDWGLLFLLKLKLLGMLEGLSTSLSSLRTLWTIPETLWTIPETLRTAQGGSVAFVSQLTPEGPRALGGLVFVCSHSSDSMTGDDTAVGRRRPPRDFQKVGTDEYILKSVFTNLWLCSYSHLDSKQVG